MPEKAYENGSGLILYNHAGMATYMLDQAFLLFLNLDYLERTFNIQTAGLCSRRLALDSTVFSAINWYT